MTDGSRLSFNDARDSGKIESFGLVFEGCFYDNS